MWDFGFISPWCSEHRAAKVILWHIQRVWPANNTATTSASAQIFWFTIYCACSCNVYCFCVTRWDGKLLYVLILQTVAEIGAYKWMWRHSWPELSDDCVQWHAACQSDRYRSESSSRLNTDALKHLAVKWKRVSFEGVSMSGSVSIYSNACLRTKRNLLIQTASALMQMKANSRADKWTRIEQDIREIFKRLRHSVGYLFKTVWDRAYLLLTWRFIRRLHLGFAAYWCFQISGVKSLGTSVDLFSTILHLSFLTCRQSSTDEFSTCTEDIISVTAQLWVNVVC